MKSPQRSPTNPGSVRSRFTQVFLQSLLRIRKHNPTSLSPSPSSSRKEFLKRCHRVKLAAYVSMARAVGTRRAWSRAMLWRVRNDARRHRLFRGRCSRSSSRERSPGKKKRKKTKKRKDDEEHGFGPAEKLQKLVPGGEAMDFYSLLDETAHYIKCLVTQVKVMRSVADFYSL